jgi:hypothetical protein
VADRKTVKPLDPARLSAKQLAQLLTKAGHKTVTADQIIKQKAKGMPLNKDGTIHLLHFAAGLSAQL